MAASLTDMVVAFAVAQHNARASASTAPSGSCQVLTADLRPPTLTRMCRLGTVSGSRCGGLLMPLIFASEHFEITTPAQPHVSRADGGHIIVNPKVAVEDRTHLTRDQAVELIKLT